MRSGAGWRLPQRRLEMSIDKVLDGSVTQAQGAWVSLGGFSSLDIFISASSVARDKGSTMSAEVEALKSGTSTYTKLPVQLVIY